MSSCRLARIAQAPSALRPAGIGRRLVQLATHVTQDKRTCTFCAIALSRPEPLAWSRCHRSCIWTTALVLTTFGQVRTPVRAARHEALAALVPGDGRDVRGMPDGMLAPAACSSTPT